MKTCKSCKEEIHEEATRCPKCYSYQKWYGSYQLAFLFLFMMFAPFLITKVFLKNTFSRSEEVSFKEYKTDLSLIKLSQDTLVIKDKEMINLIVQIENKSEYKWKNATFEVEYIAPSGKLLNIETRSAYSFVIYGGETKKSAFKVPLYKEHEGAQLKVNLIELHHER